MAVVYASERGLSVEVTSAFVSAIYVGGLLLQYPIGWMSDRMDRRRLIGMSAMVGIGACILGIVGSDYLTAIFAAAFILGGMANPLYSLLIAHTNDFLPAEKMASASSGLVFLNGLGAAAGPVTVGYVMGWFGPNGFFLFNAVLCAAIATYAVYRMDPPSGPCAGGDGQLSARRLAFGGGGGDSRRTLRRGGGGELRRREWRMPTRSSISG